VLYSDLQQRIAQRCGQRTDLSQIIYDESQDRIAYWSAFFFYTGDVTDTSLVCTRGNPWYDLPGGIRNVTAVRFLLGGTPGIQATTTAALTLPQAVIPLSSVAGFPVGGGTVEILGFPVTYTGISGLNLTGCTGGIDAAPSGTVVTLAGGVWVDLNRAPYKDVLYADPLSPPNQGPPYAYCQFGTRLRLYLTPDNGYPLEITGNAAPPAPVLDTDDNFWTEDASKLIIASTVLEIGQTYAGWAETKLAPWRLVEKREKYKLLKITADLSKPNVVRMWL
jgi:hypothetical protein